MKIKMLTVHCSATENGVDVSVDTIRAWHLARGFLDIGYHYIIGVDGTVHPGRPENNIGAHVSGANDGNLGVCLIGKDKFTRAQFKSLRKMIDNYGVPFFCHYQFSTAKKIRKTCPNIDINTLGQWYINNDTSELNEHLLGG